jgi:hypothetical protein
MINPEFHGFLLVCFKGRGRLWKVRWILKFLKKAKLQLKVKTVINRTDKIYGLVRPRKLRRV